MKKGFLFLLGVIIITAGCIAPDVSLTESQASTQFFDYPENVSATENVSETVSDSPYVEKSGSEESVAVETVEESVKEALSVEEQTWRNRIEAAMENTYCIDVPRQAYPSSYYQ